MTSESPAIKLVPAYERCATMKHLDLTSSVPDWLVAYPALLAVFEELQIDYSCGGKSVERACLERRIDPEELWAHLLANYCSTPSGTPTLEHVPVPDSCRPEPGSA